MTTYLLPFGVEAVADVPENFVAGAARERPDHSGLRDACFNRARELRQREGRAFCVRRSIAGEWFVVPADDPGYESVGSLVLSHCGPP